MEVNNMLSNISNLSKALKTKKKDPSQLVSFKLTSVTAVREQIPLQQ
jgi:hypothetical protein